MYSGGTPLYELWHWPFTSLYGPAFLPHEIDRRAHRSAAELTYCVMISSHLAAIVGLWIKHGNIELFIFVLYTSPPGDLRRASSLEFWRILRFALRGQIKKAR